MKSDQIYLRHILDAISLIEKYSRDKTFEDVLQDSLLQDGLIRQLMVIGEAGAYVSDELRNTHPEIPWSNMIGMRNILVHKYFGIDLKEVWKTVQESVPALKRQVSQILTSM